MADRATRDYLLRKRFGMSLRDYDELLRVQRFSCAICGSVRNFNKGKEVAFCVDHDHQTGDVRGLLCTDCNIALGHFKDCPVNISMALNYIINAVVAHRVPMPPSSDADPTEEASPYEEDGTERS